MHKPLRALAAAALIASAGCASHSTIPSTDSRASSSSVATQNNGTDQTTLTYIPLPAPYSYPWSFKVGPDNLLYFAEWGSTGNDGGVGRLNADGTITEVDVSPAASTPILGAFDASGNLWFSNCGGFFCSGYDALDALNSSGTLIYALGDTGVRPRFSAADPNGNIWYALQRADAVARVSSTGVVTQFPLPKLAFDRATPNDVVLGPDGALWITEYIGNAIVRMSLDGTVTNVYTIPTAEAAPRFIATGTDGNLWFSENGSENDFGDPYSPPQIVRMTTSGEMTAYSLPSPLSAPDSLRAANGGFVFADIGSNAVGFIDYSGNVVEWPIAYDGGASGNTQFALQGADGAIYFADDDQNRIGKITLGKKGMIFPQTFTMAGAGSTQLVGVGVVGDRGPYTATIDNTSVATVAPISGFPMNFTVTANAPGSATLTIKGKGKAMTASITVTAGSTTQSIRLKPVRRRLPR